MFWHGQLNAECPLWNKMVIIKSIALLITVNYFDRIKSQLQQKKGILNLLDNSRLDKYLRTTGS